MRGAADVAGATAAVPFIQLLSLSSAMMSSFPQFTPNSHRVALAAAGSAQQKGRIGSHRLALASPAPQPCTHSTTAQLSRLLERRLALLRLLACCPLALARR